MKKVVLQSPAKLNLFLKVKNKRKDGFHSIDTIFERIDLADEISFSENARGKISIACAHPQVPVGPKNLVYKVAKKLINNTNNKGVHIHIKKNIPVAAGLAGGSTNAATAIEGLNRLWGLRLGLKEKLDIAQEIGSDVSFFIHNCSWARGTGRGERIEKLKIKAKLWQILVVPKVKMYAGEVYGAYKNSLTKKRGNASILIHNLMKSNMLGVSLNLLNDLEQPIFKLNPRLLKLKHRLNSLNAMGAMVSGSGPAVFGITESKSEAEKIRKKLAQRFSQVFVVRTL